MPSTTASDRAVPHNLEAERALLGSILLDNSALNMALEVVGRDDFFSEAHRITFEKMVGISEKNRTIDLVTPPRDCLIPPVISDREPDSQTSHRVS